MIRRFALVPIGVGLALSSANAADDKKPPAPPKVQAQKAPPAPRPGVVRPPAARPTQTQPDNHPGEQQLDRLLKMSPDERQKWMQNLPAQRRQNLERRLNEVAKLPASQQNHLRTRLEMLNSLPQPRQGQVRRSINQFNNLPDERKNQISLEMRRIAVLPDEDRRAYMNTEEFRNKYSAHEQQIMSNLSEIIPEGQPQD